MSDGELQEGQIWEALQVSVYYKLDNLKQSLMLMSKS